MSALLCTDWLNLPFLFFLFNSLKKMYLVYMCFPIRMSVYHMHVQRLGENMGSWELE